jgi:carboxylesterase type B
MSLKVCEALDQFGSTLFSKSLQEITGREDRQMEAMHSVPVEQIIRHSISESANDCYEPAIDRRASIKPMSSMEALLAGNFHQVPVLLGVTENDGLGKSELEQTIFCQSEVRSRADLEELFRRDFGENAATVLSHYWPKDVESEARAVHQALSLFSNDLWYFAGTHLMAKLISSSSPVFLYCFAGAKRSMHGSDMASWRVLPKASCPRSCPDILETLLDMGIQMAMICSQKLQLIFLNGNPCRKLRMNGCF